MGHELYDTVLYFYYKRQIIQNFLKTINKIEMKNILFLFCKAPSIGNNRL